MEGVALGRPTRKYKESPGVRRLPSRLRWNYEKQRKGSGIDAGSQGQHVRGTSDKKRKLEELCFGKWYKDQRVELSVWT